MTARFAALACAWRRADRAMSGRRRNEAVTGGGESVRSRDREVRDGADASKVQP